MSRRLCSQRAPIPKGELRRKKLREIERVPGQHCRHLMLRHLSLLLVASALGATAAEPDHPALRDVNPVDDPAQAAAHLAVAPGLRADLWAAEPDLENPVSFSFDERGRCFVAETFRRKTSTMDIRAHRNWLPQSLAMRSVNDRRLFLEGAFDDQKMAPYLGLAERNGDGRLDWRDLAVESERIRLLEDRSGRGRADHAEVFATGFNTAVTGIGSGVLAHGRDVYFACLPDLWRLRDGKRESLVGGFGVHITYTGHDLHGLIMGPDGRLYWTIGDCGARVTTKEGRVIDVADTGAVFRANPDGTACELVMRGLRNPQDLCFNDAGDFFTADNNADGGDAARWVQVVEGGDAGWQIGFQAQPGLGAWNGERLWSPDAARTALALLPPIGAVGHGPAGIAHYPGTGLPEVWRDHFFVCDFPGGVRAFTLRPRGASYEIAAPAAALVANGYDLTNKLGWGFYPTDVDFGVEGGVSVLDWVRDETKPGKGRIFRLSDPATDASPIVRETKRLLGEGMAARPAEELATLLAHADRRVRLAAQFQLAEKADTATLERVARSSATQLARIHALWGLGQLARKNPAAAQPALELLRDADPEVRAQSAKLLGDARLAAAGPALIAPLSDSEPRVRFHAALALGKVGTAEAVPALFAMLRSNDDPFLRHAGVVALAHCADRTALVAAADDDTVTIRATALLALRRQGQPDVARFLADRDPQLVLEAASAIYDTPIEAALPQLAALSAKPDLPQPVLQRAIDANYFLGDATAAERLTHLATTGAAPEWAREEALQALAEWNQLLHRDRFLGLWRPLPVIRDSRAPAALLAQIFSRLLAPAASPRIRAATVNAAAQLSLQQADLAIASIATDPAAEASLRAAALQALAAMSSPRTRATLAATSADPDPTVRARSLDLLSRLDPTRALEAATTALKLGTLREKQNALRTLASLDGKEATRQLGKWLDRYDQGTVPPALELDLFEAVAERDSPELKKRLAAIRTARSIGRLGPWRECIQGGDAARGREIFVEKAEAGCLRCHRVRGLGGDVGPDLSAIGARLDRVNILKAILFPNDSIAHGYETVYLTLRDGTQTAGVVLAEDAAHLRLRLLADGRETRIEPSQITQRQRLPSLMPEGLGPILGQRDLRDVVEFLTSQK